MEEIVDLNKQREWSGPPGKVKIPEAYIRDLRYEIVVFARKERGGSDFTFRCKEYKRTADEEYKFRNVIIDTSKRNPKGEVELIRLTYHPRVTLANVAFMIIPAPEDVDSSSGSSP